MVRPTQRASSCRFGPGRPADRAALHRPAARLGFHLQSPRFLVALSALLFLMGLNLLGVFELGLGLTQLGQGLCRCCRARSSGLCRGLCHWSAGDGSGHTLHRAVYEHSARLRPQSAAAPCAADLHCAGPGAGAAVCASDLAAGPAPPDAAAGSLMETFKQVMGFLLLGTVVWLAWILAAQVGGPGVVALLMGLLGVGFPPGCCVAGPRYGQSWGSALGLSPWPPLDRAGSLRDSLPEPASVGHAIGCSGERSGQSGHRLGSRSPKRAWLLTAPPVTPSSSTSPPSGACPARSTSAWCAVRQRASSPARQRYRDDEGRLDQLRPRITGALSEFGKSAIPFTPSTVAMPAGPVELPAILTPSLVLDAIDRAR